MYKSYYNYQYLIVPYQNDQRFSSNFTGKGFIGVNKECGIYVLYIQTSEINFFSSLKIESQVLQIFPICIRYKWNTGLICKLWYGNCGFSVTITPPPESKSILLSYSQSETELKFY